MSATVETYHARPSAVTGTKADGWSGGRGHRDLKRRKARRERRKAKRVPDCLPTYGRYNGWET